ncbi:Lrp/AsnC family transcriptional regulator [Pseudoalteromonas sp. YIC-827]|uniref:Lrp/AsnC family transcriptional regulator n=1 Tax=Pseudoalteromonas qingdaonensis TaxID=3131913 RepID=A0ABU9N066_9GAMM
MSDSSQKIKIDQKDLQLLALLQQDGRIAVSELAQRVSLSDTPVLRRINKLQQACYIRGYHAQLDAAKLGFAVSVYALIRLTQNAASAAERFENHVASLPQVQECSVITGEYDYLLKIVAQDLPSYEHFVKHALGSCEDIAAIESTVVLKQTFSRWQLPLSD